MAILLDLPEDIIALIFSYLDFATRRSIVPLVCKEWLRVTQLCPSVWQSVELDADEEFEVFKLLNKTEFSEPYWVCWQQWSKGRYISIKTAARWLKRRLVVTSLWIEGGRQTLQSFRMFPGCLAETSALLSPTLRVLDLGCSRWVSNKECFSVLSCLVNLEHLSICVSGFLTKCSSGDLEGLACLTKLERLTIQVWQKGVLEPFPESFYTLTQLKVLEIESSGSYFGNEGRDQELFSSRLGLLSCLETVQLVGLLDGHLSSDATLPWALTSLDLRSNELSFRFCSEISFAQQLLPFSGLQKLDLGGNYLEEIPYLGGLAGLNFLNLEGNQLSELPDMSHLRSLKLLNCAWNRFKSLPVEQLLGLGAIESIDFSCQGRRAGPHPPRWVVGGWVGQDTAGPGGLGFKAMAMSVPASVTSLSKLSCLVSLDVSRVPPLELPRRGWDAVQGLVEDVRAARPESHLVVRFDV